MSEQEALTKLIDDLVNRSFSPRMIAIEIIDAGWHRTSMEFDPRDYYVERFDAEAML